MFYVPQAIKVYTPLILSYTCCDISSLNPHEQVLHDRAERYEAYLRDVGPGAVMPAVIADPVTRTIIDGHHRVQVIRRLGYKRIQTLFIDYDHPAVYTGSQSGVTKDDVRHAGISGDLLAPKSTAHLVEDVEKQGKPIVLLSPLFDIGSVEC